MTFYGAENQQKVVNVSSMHKYIWRLWYMDAICHILYKTADKKYPTETEVNISQHAENTNLPNTDKHIVRHIILFPLINKFQNLVVISVTWPVWHNATVLYN